MSDIIWFNKEIRIEQLQPLLKDTMAAFLGMRWEEAGSDYLKMSMPVDDRTKQPYGLLHGGASCALAETIGSVSSYLMIDPEKYICVGLDINANHLKSATEGRVTAVSSPLHIGKTTHVWDIRIFNDMKELICISRLTVAVREKKNR